MPPICLLDSDRLSGLLTDALSWTDVASSLLVSAKNGSILAYAFRHTTPSIRDMRTKSATATAAYTAASENTLVFESPGDRQITVIAPIADHLLLTVSGGKLQHALDHAAPAKQPSLDGQVEGESSVRTEETDRDGDEDDDDDKDPGHEQLRADLEMVSQELATSLREELGDMKWPEDI